MTLDIQQIWVYLAARPLTGLLLTLLAYQGGVWLYRVSGQRAICNPVLIAVLALIAILFATGTDYASYFEGAQFVHFLLGPATVALAVPLYRQLQRVRQSLRALTIALICGALTGIVSAVVIAWLLRAPGVVIASLAPKSVTTPIAMGVAERVGGLPSLTAAVVIVTGIFGAAVGPSLLSRAGIKSPQARGLAMGVSAHGIGTARALEESQIAGAFSGLAIGLNGLATAILLPLLYQLTLAGWQWFAG